MTEQEHRRQLHQAFQEVVLSIGGIVATFPVEDGVVRAIAGAIGRIATRHFSDRSGRSPAMDPTRPNPRRRLHPAIVDLLARIGSPAGSPPAATADAETEASEDAADEEWLRLPGLFRRWEFAEVIDVGDEFLVEEAGHDEAGGSLFVINSRPHAGKEEP